jgi:hypothetical protein
MILLILIENNIDLSLYDTNTNFFIQKLDKTRTIIY